MAREIGTVIDQILEEPDLPVDLISGLSKVRTSVAYTAPELMRERWMQCAMIITEYSASGVLFSSTTNPVFIDPNGWQARVFNIWMDK